MAQTITNNTRTEAVKTVSSHYFFNIGGTFSSNTFALEWSEDGTTWYPLKDSEDGKNVYKVDSVEQLFEELDS